MSFGCAVSDNGAWAVTGTLVITANTFTVSSGKTLTVTNSNGGTLNVTGGTLANAGTISNAGSVTISSGATLSNTGTLSGNITDNGTVSFIASTVYSNAISGAGVVMVNPGNGNTVVFTGINTYTGTTTVTSGTLQLGNGTTNGSAANSVLDVLSGSTIKFNETGAVNIGNTVEGAGTLYQAGSGTLTLSGANTYTGGTTLAGGTLNVTGSIANSAVAVQSGATLEGTGTIGGAVSIAGGTLISGTTSPGILKTGNLSFNSTSHYAVQVNGSTAGTSYGQTQVTGTITLNNAILSLTGTRTEHAGDAIILITNDGSDAVSGTFAGLAEGTAVTLNNVVYYITYLYNGNDVALVDKWSAVAHLAPDAAPDTSAADVVYATGDIAVTANDLGWGSRAATARKWPARKPASATAGCSPISPT